MVDKYLKGKGEKLSLGEFAGGRQGGRAGMGRGRMGWEDVQMIDAVHDKSPLGG